MNANSSDRWLHAKAIFEATLEGAASLTVARFWSTRAPATKRSGATWSVC